jgi:hypothetical protein
MSTASSVDADARGAAIAARIAPTANRERIGFFLSTATACRADTHRPIATLSPIHTPTQAGAREYATRRDGRQQPAPDQIKKPQKTSEAGGYRPRV